MDAMVVRLTGPGDRPFVGRRRELAVAARILSDGDRAGVVLIGGESGQGKTRLVEEIIADAPAETTVIRAVAVPRATSIPFELIRSVLDVGSNGPPADSVEPANRVQQEAEALRSLAAGATIFVFEDVHWSDPESLDVVDRLLVAGPLGA
ncbi:MAG: ATP-binding protein, partial [Actinomycetota bacterium]